MSNQEEADAASVLSQMSQLVHLSPDLASNQASNTSFGDRKGKEMLASVSHSSNENAAYETSEHAYAQNSETNSSSFPERQKGNVASESKKHRCTVCGKHFSKLYNLRAHTRVHTKERPYQCLVCVKAFSLYGDLIRHGRIHSGEKPYQCGRCGHRFTDYGTYKRHTRLHTNEYPYVCPVCQKAFNRLDSYNNHMLTHSREKPFVCEFCHKEFNYNSSYKRHLRSHSAEWNYSCSVCDKKFTRSDSLKCHNRVHDTPSNQIKGETMESSEDVLVTNLSLENELVINGMESVQSVCEDEMISLPSTYGHQQPLCLQISDGAGDALLSLRDAMQNELEGRNTEFRCDESVALPGKEVVSKAKGYSYKSRPSTTSSSKGAAFLPSEETSKASTNLSYVSSLCNSSTAVASQDPKSTLLGQEERHFTSVSVQTEPIFNESPEAMREFLCSIDSLMNPASSLATPDSNNTVCNEMSLSGSASDVLQRPTDFSAVNNLIKSITTPLLELIQRKEPLASDSQGLLDDSVVGVCGTGLEDIITQTSTTLNNQMSSLDSHRNLGASYSGAKVTQEVRCSVTNPSQIEKNIDANKSISDDNTSDCRVQNVFISDSSACKAVVSPYSYHNSPSSHINRTMKTDSYPFFKDVKDARDSLKGEADIPLTVGSGFEVFEVTSHKLEHSEYQEGGHNLVTAEVVNVAREVTLSSNGNDSQSRLDMNLPHQIMEDDPDVGIPEC